MNLFCSCSDPHEPLQLQNFQVRSQAGNSKISEKNNHRGTVDRITGKWTTSAGPSMGDVLAVAVPRPGAAIQPPPAVGLVAGRRRPRRGGAVYKHHCGSKTKREEKGAKSGGPLNRRQSRSKAHKQKPKKPWVCVESWPMDFLVRKS